MIIGKKYKKLIAMSLVASIIFILVGCNKKDDTIYNDTDKGQISLETENIRIPFIEDLSKIDNLKSLKFEKDNKANLLSLEEVVTLIGREGEISYPTEGDESLKVIYWIYEDNGIEYFLDTTFYMDKLVNIESKIVSTTEIVDISSKSLESNYINNISNIKSYSELKEILGEGTLVMNYFVPSNDRIYIWKYNNEYISVYVYKEDIVSYVATSSDVNNLIKSSTSCH